MHQNVIAHGRSYAKALTASMPPPAFYKEHYFSIDIAKKLADSSSIVQYCSDCMRKKGAALGHSFYHSEKVAIESAAIVLIERGVSSGSMHLAALALIAGFLHDYYREKSNHPEKAAEYVELHFSHFIAPDDVKAISFAIKNHEAFKEHQRVDNNDLMLLSDALYDADKFRWGPDNFQYTIWDMISAMDISMTDMAAHFPKGVSRIDAIRNTFRTKTGIRYGPEFIDQGLVIAGGLLKFLQEGEQSTQRA